MSKSKNTSDKLLLVEGPDDEHVIYQIGAAYEIPHFEVKSSGGVESLLQSLPIRLKQSNLRKFGIVLDADTNLTGRWQSLTQIFQHSGYSLPNAPPRDGLLVDPSNPSEPRPRVGVWIMPDNELTGSLEDFLRVLIPKPSPLLDHAATSIQAIPSEARRIPERFKTKALIHTYLAWQAEPGKPFGQALKARYLDIGDPLAQRFSAWLTKLFS